MSGKLTSERIWGATIFVDHFTDFVFVYLVRNLTRDETITAKKSFEKAMAAAGHEVEAYRADNGVFATKGF